MSQSYELRYTQRLMLRVRFYVTRAVTNKLFLDDQRSRKTERFWCRIEFYEGISRLFLILRHLSVRVECAGLFRNVWIIITLFQQFIETTK